MRLVIPPGGWIRCVYGEAIDLAALGSLAICRASYIEPDAHGQWEADLAPANGPRLGPFHCRSDALAAEEDWLSRHWLTSADAD